MRLRIRLSGLLAAVGAGLLAVPAAAQCAGCTGTVNQLVAVTEGNATGSLAGHALHVKCTYHSQTNGGGGFVGLMNLDMTTTSAPPSNIHVEGTCTMITAGSLSWSLSDSEGATSSPGFHASAGRPNMPANLVVEQICVNARATWTSGTTVDRADLSGCSDAGVHIDPQGVFDLVPQFPGPFHAEIGIDQCEVGSTEGPSAEGDVRVGVLSGGPVTATDTGTVPPVIAAMAQISMTCTIQVGPTGETHAGTDAASASAHGTGVAIVPPTLLDYVWPEGTNAYLCTSATIDDTAYYWDSTNGGFSTSNAVECAPIITQEVSNPIPA